MPFIYITHIYIIMFCQIKDANTYTRIRRDLHTFNRLQYENVNVYTRILKMANIVSAHFYLSNNLLSKYFLCIIFSLSSEHFTHRICTRFTNTSKGRRKWNFLNFLCLILTTTWMSTFKKLSCPFHISIRKKYIYHI